MKTIAIIFQNEFMSEVLENTITLLSNNSEFEISKIEWKSNYRSKFTSLKRFDLYVNLSKHTFNTKNFAEDNLIQVPIINNINNGISRELYKAIIQKDECFEAVVTQKYQGKQGYIIKKANYKILHFSYEKSFKSILNHLPYLINDSINKFLFYPTSIKKEVWEDNHPRIIPIQKFKLQLRFRQYLHYLKVLFTYDSWKIGICEHSIIDVVKNKHLLNHCTWIESFKRKDFVADPFGFKIGNDEYVIYEKLKGINKKGIIEVRQLNQNKPIYKFELPSHLSYPYIFEENYEIYIIPEQHKLNKIDLYKWNNELKQIEFVKTLINNFSGVDNSIVKWENKYWLFCTNSDRKAADLNLHLFYSDKLDGIWIPHKLNPIITSITTARPAGSIFSIGNKLYRPAQNSGQTYGGSLSIFEINELSIDNYDENLVEKITPEDIDANKFSGIHTISILGNKTLFDVKTKRFKFWKFYT